MDTFLLVLLSFAVFFDAVKLQITQSFYLFLLSFRIPTKTPDISPFVLSFLFLPSFFFHFFFFFSSQVSHCYDCWLPCFLFFTFDVASYKSYDSFFLSFFLFSLSQVSLLLRLLTCHLAGFSFDVTSNKLHDSLFFLSFTV